MCLLFKDWSSKHILIHHNKLERKRPCIHCMFRIFDKAVVCIQSAQLHLSQFNKSAPTPISESERE